MGTVDGQARSRQGWHCLRSGVGLLALGLPAPGPVAASLPVDCRVFRLELPLPMEHALPRPGLNGSALVDLLARMGLAEGPSVRPSFVDGLERWLGWTDAIALSAVLGAQEPPQPPQPPQPPLREAALPAAAAARETLARLQALLTRRIERDGLSDEDVEFASWRRHVNEVRQAMQAEIASLRAQLRSGLSTCGAAQRRLAALDAVLEQAVAPREQAALAALPAWLHKCFERGRPPQAEGLGTPVPATNRQWLQAFRQDMRRLLQAELELRLQPLHGMVEAMDAGPAKNVSRADDGTGA